MHPPDWAIRTKADSLAIERGCYWDEKEASAILVFAETYFRSQYTRQDFQLLPWQRRFLMSLYGWRLPSNHRRFRYANLHIAKKNGKTLLVSIISAFETLASGEPSPFVISVAASKDNASQVFKEIRYTVENSFRRLVEDKVIRITQSKTDMRIRVKEINAEFHCFPTNGDTAHGWNCSQITIDECHAIRSPAMWQALKYNIDARVNGLCVLISTAGNDTTHWYYSAIYSKSKRILSGEDLDITWYAEVYESDPKADAETDVTQWYAANPSLGTAFSEEQFRLQLLAAKENVGEWLNFQKLKLNRWVRPDEAAYLDVSNWSAFAKEISEDELKSLPCAVGCDLSQTVDPTSISQVFELPNRQYFVRSWAWVTKAGVKLRERSNLPLYQQWLATGELEDTEGDMIDDRQVKAHLLKLCQTYNVKAVNFDPTSAFILMGELQSEGYNVGRFPQSFRYFNGPMREFERAYKEGRILHDIQADWLRYCFSNVRFELSRHDEIRPVKKRSVDHIDGAIASLLAFASLVTPDPKIAISREGIGWI